MNGIKLAQGLRELDRTAWSPQATTGGVWALLSNMLERIPYYLGGLALLALLYSGAMYVMAMGDPAKMESAKKNITWAVIGIIAVASVTAIITFLAWMARPGI